jgi:hypothetical protein
MARPQGEIRQALAGAAERLVMERGLVVDGTAVDGVTWRDMAAAAQVGWDVARETVKNMANAGELARIGRTKPAGSDRWMTVFVPSAMVGDDTWPQPWGGIEALASAMRPSAASEAYAD